MDQTSQTPEHHQSTSRDDTHIPWDEPPPYELHSSGSILASSAAVNDQGGIDINFFSSKPKQLDELLPAIPSVHEAEAHVSQTDDTVCPRLNIVIQVVGSRGDVQPFVALGNALQRYGHRVRLATHGNFADFVTKARLEFFSIGGDPEDLMAYMVKNPGLIPSLESLRGGDIGRKRRMMYEMLRGCWKSCVEPDASSGRPFVADVIIANPPSFAHVHCAEALGVPLHIMFTMPWSATRVFPHPLASISAQNMDPRTSNYLSYGVVDLMTWQGLGDIINAWRKRDLGLEALPAAVGPDIVNILKIPHTYCWSPALVAKPADWGDHIDISGFFMREEPSYTPPADLDEFLSQGSQPIYVGFGSIVLSDASEVTRVIKEAFRRLGVRVIISRGWSKLGGDEPNSADVFYVDDCPHEWLFKRVAAVVHHGGAGTTACGLINGCPTTIVPFFGDQPFWGRVVASNGAGPSPIPIAKLSTESLSSAIEFCLTPSAKAAAQTISSQMRRDNGVEAAVASFHRHLPVNAMTCDLLPANAARWVYHPKSRSGKAQATKLSDDALQILMQSHELKSSDVEPLRSINYHAESRRWDPVTAGASSVFGTITDFTSALGGTFVDPFKEVKRVRAGGENEHGSASGAAAKAARQGVMRMTTAVTKGMLVDVPLAFTEGLRNAPRLLGEEVRDHGEVKDWKKGCAVAAKNFTDGFYDGVTGVVTKPMEQARGGGGALGVLKGVGQGSVGLFTKPGSAMFGLLAYPAQGIYKSIKSSQGGGVERAVRIGRGEELRRQESSGGRVDVPSRQVVTRFRELRAK